MSSFTGARLLSWLLSLLMTTTTQTFKLSCCDGEEEGVCVALLGDAVGGREGVDEADAALCMLLLLSPILLFHRGRARKSDAACEVR